MRFKYLWLCFYTDSASLLGGKKHRKWEFRSVCDRSHCLRSSLWIHKSKLCSSMSNEAFEINAFDEVDEAMSMSI